MYTVKNVSSNRKIVSTISDGTTLRLMPGQSVELKDEQVSNYLVTLSKSKDRLLTLTKKQTKSFKKSIKKDESILESKEE